MAHSAIPCVSPINRACAHFVFVLSNFANHHGIVVVVVVIIVVVIIVVVVAAAQYS
jgi:hypothetical protein